MGARGTCCAATRVVAMTWSYVLAEALPFLFLLALAAVLWLRSHRQLVALRAASNTRRTLRHGLVELLSKLLQERPPNAVWARALSTYYREGFNASCSLVYSRQESPDGLPAIRLWDQGGTWPLAPLAEESVVRLNQDLPTDFFWSKQPLSYSGEAVRTWLPPALGGHLASTLVVPLGADTRLTCMLLLGRGSEQPPFSEHERELLADSVPAVNLALAAMVANDERQRLELALNKAHEEGMLQISTGIIHNIGNSITVIQLAVDQLRSDEMLACRDVAALLAAEVLPTLQKELAAGRLQTFLADDPQGREYLPSLDALVNQLNKLLGKHYQDLEFIANKFQSVTEVIALQQQFIGELGTENVVHIRSVLDDVVKMCQAPIELRDIKLETHLDAQGRVLCDPAMLRHILLVLFKHSIESASASRKVNPCITLASRETTEEGKAWLHIILSDNGAGITVNVSDLSKTTQLRPGDERARELLFCRRRIEKYGGKFEVASDFAHGLRIDIALPQYTEPTAAAKPADKGDKTTKLAHPL